MKLIGLFAAVGLAGQGAAAAKDDERLNEFIAAELRVRDFRTVRADLNDDSRPEVFVYGKSGEPCADGGCPLHILSPTHGSYRIVLAASAAAPPVVVLATSTRGWRDVGVGSISAEGPRRGELLRLQFDGERYPGTRTASTPMRRWSGRVLIKE